MRLVVRGEAAKLVWCSNGLKANARQAWTTIKIMGEEISPSHTRSNLVGR